MNDEDYLIEFTCTQKHFIYIPCKNGYRVIAEAVRNVCALFDSNLSAEGIHKEISKEKKKEKTSKDRCVLVICTQTELVEMVKYHNSYWISPEKLELKHLLEPTHADPFKKIAREVYRALMRKVSHS